MHEHSGQHKPSCGIVEMLARGVLGGVKPSAREFYELVLPPVDMHLKDNVLTVKIDLPGFAKEDIQLRVRRGVLYLSAARKAEEADESFYSHRPLKIRKRIRLPMHTGRDEEATKTAKYEDGVLTVSIEAPKLGQSINIE